MLGSKQGQENMLQPCLGPQGLPSPTQDSALGGKTQVAGASRSTKGTRMSALAGLGVGEADELQVIFWLIILTK